MITAIELTNFKGVGERQRIELAPLTLMFGANSAGKSTVLQAMLYLQELLERGQPDINRTEFGGGLVDLGGFERLVHRHELHRQLGIKVEFECQASLLPESSADDGFLSDLDDGLRTVSVYVGVSQVAWASGSSPCVKSLVIGDGSVHGALIEVDELAAELRDEGEALTSRQILTVRHGHPLLAAMPVELRAVFGASAEPSFDTSCQGYFSGSELGVIPAMDRPLNIDFVGSTEDVSSKQLATNMVEMLIIGPLRQLVRELREMLYIGPLRAIPPRGYLSDRAPRASRWPDGLAAWDALLSDRTSLVKATNQWLHRLGTNCAVVIQQLYDRDASAEAITLQQGNAVVRRLLLDMGSNSHALPCEVGAGISQVVPVVVASLEPGRKRFVMIEQPELHVHPALQVGLGDLFIEASRDRQLLVETHSEHVILRLLRRIRETSEQELPTGGPSFTPEQLSVLYVENTPTGTVFKRLRVDEEGEFVDRWPKGFFEERAGELF